jgi:NAD(P)-dependent dehydrogenase (short-subunit alcohol dehydrogenase family)
MGSASAVKPLINDNDFSFGPRLTRTQGPVNGPPSGAQVALVTGGARGQGRSHAVNLAKRGADVVVLDILEQIPSVEYEMSRQADMDETVKLIEAEDRRVVPVKGDVRSWDDVQNAVNAAITEFGRLDLVSANAGIMPTTGEPSQQLDAWHAAIDTMLTGVYYTLRAATEPMVESGRGGSIVITGSTSTFQGVAFNQKLLNPGQIGYGAAKHGVVAIMRNFAKALGQFNVRVNLVAPQGVRTPMLINPYFGPSVRDGAPPGWMANVMNTDLVEPQDVSEAVLWLLSDQARYGRPDAAGLRRGRDQGGGPRRRRLRAQPHPGRAHRQRRAGPGPVPGLGRAGRPVRTGHHRAGLTAMTRTSGQLFRTCSCRSPSAP